MNPYYLCERLKTNRLFVRKASIYISLICLLIIFILSTDYLYVHLFNWWYTIIVPIITSYTCALLVDLDKKKDLFLKTMPIDLTKIWLSKIRIAAIYLSHSYIILLIAFLSFKCIIGDNYPNISYYKGIGGTLILYICSLWQIPFFLYTAYKIKLFGILLVSIFCNTIIGTMAATTNYWFLFPFSYLSKLGFYILHITPSGLFENNIKSYFFEIMMCIVFSIILFIIITRQTAKWYINKEV